LRFLFLEQTAKHPGGLFVELDALGEKVGTGFVGRFFHDGVNRPGSAHDGLVSVNEELDHLFRPGNPGDFPDAAEVYEFAVGSGGWQAEGANPLGDGIDGDRHLGVVGLEHHVQGLEHGAGDVPVKVVGLQIERVGVGEETGKPRRDVGAVCFTDADVDGRAGCHWRKGEKCPVKRFPGGGRQ